MLWTTWVSALSDGRALEGDRFLNVVMRLEPGVSGKRNFAGDGRGHIMRYAIYLLSAIYLSFIINNFVLGKTRKVS